MICPWSRLRAAFLCLSIVTASLAAATPARAQTSNRNRLLPDISAILTFGGWYFSDTPTPRPGVTSADEDAHDHAGEDAHGGHGGHAHGHEPFHSRDGFRLQLQELELAIQSFVDPFVRADMFMSVSLHGIEIEEAFATTLALPWNLQAKAGMFYAGFGRFNPQHFLETTPFVDMPLVNRRVFGGEQLRGLGLSVSYLAPVPWYLEARAEAMTADNPISFGVSGEAMAGPQDMITLGHVKNFFEFTDTWSLQWGLSAAQGPNASGGLGATDNNRTQVYGTDFYLKWRDLESIRSVALQSEFILRRAVFPGGRLLEGGLYTHIDARIARRWQVALRADVFGVPSDLDGVLAFDTAQKEYFTPAKAWRVGGAVSFYASEFQRVRLQYNRDHLDAPRRDVHEVFLQYQFVIGTHGAHPF